MNHTLPYLQGVNYWEAVIYGMVQGLTEFLPISSTAHIVITSYLLGTTFPGLEFEIILHQASLLAVVVYFRKELREVVRGFLLYLRFRRAEDRVQFFFGLYIAAATILTGALGLLLLRVVDDSIKSPPVVAGMLALTGLALIFIERFRCYGTRTEAHMTFLDSIWVGLGQTLAVMPGISRSGSTLVAALLCGLERETAVRYSFLLSIPVIAGSSILVLPELRTGLFAGIGLGPLLMSMAVAFAASIAGLIWLIEFLRRGKLVWFAAYLFVLALFVVLYFPADIVFEVD